VTTSRIYFKQTRHNVTYNLPCPLVLNCPAVDLLTFVHCIYQHRRSRDWAVFFFTRTRDNGWNAA